MEIHVLSDLHLEHGPFTVSNSVQSDVLVLAGDIHHNPAESMRWSAGLNRRCIVLLGNHEFYKGQWYERDRALAATTVQSLCKEGDLYFLDCSSTVIDGVRFLGCTLWSDYEVPIQDRYGPVSDQRKAMTQCSVMMPDHYNIKWRDPATARSPMVTPANLLAVHQLERQWLSDQLAQPFAGKTVVVTHHAPHARSIDPKFADNWMTPGFVSNLPDRFFEVPVLWIHGHTHCAFDYRVGNCRVVCNPRGYKLATGGYEVAGFDPELVVTV